MSTLKATGDEKIEARRYCKGDADWTDWQEVTAEFRAQHAGDSTFDFRTVPNTNPATATHA